MIGALVEIDEATQPLEAEEAQTSSEVASARSDLAEALAAMAASAEGKSEEEGDSASSIE